MRFWREFFNDLIVPFRALVVALGGVSIVLLWFGGHYLIAVGVVAVGIALGRGAAALGDRLLPEHPVTALEILEFSVLAPGTVAATATALITIVGVELAVEEPPELKAAASALATGIASFLTAVFVSWAGDRDDSSLASFIRGIFRAHYKRMPPTPQRERRVKYFPRESDGERWVYSDEFKGVSSWGRQSRRKRAEGVAKAYSKSA